MIEEVKKILKALNIEKKRDEKHLDLTVAENAKKQSEANEAYLQYILEAKVEEVLCLTNLDKLPKELEKVVINRTVGEYLSSITIRDPYDSEKSVLTSITRGEVSMSYDSAYSKEKEAEFKKITDFLLNYGTNLILKYRRIKW